MGKNDELLQDLADEGDALDRIVAAADAEGWTAPTPAAGWTVADQVGHLAWTDEVALISIEDPDGFAAVLDHAIAHIDTFTADAATEFVALGRDGLLERWRTGRTRLAAALAAVPDGVKLPWFGPPMSATSMATARLMETWAHGCDIADALGATQPATDRLRHVAYLGHRTRDFAYANRGLTPPTEPVRVELTAPSGATWTFGPDDATQSVTGPALDFCLLVIRRRHRDDLDLVATGADADAWLDIAQAFAGPAGTGPAPRGRD